MFLFNIKSNILQYTTFLQMMQFNFLEIIEQGTSGFIHASVINKQTFINLASYFSPNRSYCREMMNINQTKLLLLLYNGKHSVS